MYRFKVLNISKPRMYRPEDSKKSPSYFSGCFLILLGVLVLAVFRKSVLEDLKTLTWPHTTGHIIESRLESRQTPEVGEEATYYVPIIRYTYTVHGKQYIGTRLYLEKDVGGHISPIRKLLSYYPRGKTVQVFYAPDEPARSVLRPGFIRSTTAMGFFTGLFFLLWGWIRLWEARFFRSFYKGTHIRIAPETGTATLFFAGFWLTLSGAGLGYGIDMVHYGAWFTGGVILFLIFIGLVLFLAGYIQYVNLIRSDVHFLEILSLPEGHNMPYSCRIVFLKSPSGYPTIRLTCTHDIIIQNEHMKRIFPDVERRHHIIEPKQTRSPSGRTSFYDFEIPAEYPEPGSWPLKPEEGLLPHKEWSEYVYQLKSEGKRFEIIGKIRWKLDIFRSRHAKRACATFNIPVRFK